MRPNFPTPSRAELVAALSLTVFAAPASAQTTRWISHGPNQSTVDGPCTRPSLSDDGSIVAFISSASNLVPGDNNGVSDAFVYQRGTSSAIRISVASNGTEANAETPRLEASGGGRYIAFESRASNLVRGDTNGLTDIFVHDLSTRSTVRVSVSTNGMQGNGDCSFSALSSDGRHVAFSSASSNLVSGDTNGAQDVFLHDRAPDANGRYDEGNGVTVRLSLTSFGGNPTSGCWFPKMSADGRFVTFHSSAADIVPPDTNSEWDVFLHDRDPDNNGKFDEGNGRVTRESVGRNGVQAAGHSRDGQPSDDGRFIAFFSRAANLVPNDTNGVADVFVRDRSLGRTFRMSVATGGMQGNAESSGANFSANGRLVAFTSAATNLVAGDTNNARDVFVHDRDPDGNGRFDEGNGTTQRESLNRRDRQASSGAGFYSFSRTGRFLAMDSTAKNLGSADRSGRDQIYLRDRIKIDLIGVVRSGQPFAFEFHNAVGTAGRRAHVLFTCSGTAPGIQILPKLAAPLNFDVCTSASLLWQGSLQGPVRADGTARTRDLTLFGVPVGVDIDAVGLILDSASGLPQATTAPLRFRTQ